MRSAEGGREEAAQRGETQIYSWVKFQLLDLSLGSLLGVGGEGRPYPVPPGSLRFPRYKGSRDSSPTYSLDASELG